MIVVERDGPAAELVEAVEGLDQVAEEGVAPELAVGDHVEARLFLEADGVVDRAVLDLLERGGAELARLEPPARVLQRLRAQRGSPPRHSDRAALACPVHHAPNPPPENSRTQSERTTTAGRRSRRVRPRL